MYRHALFLLIVCSLLAAAWGCQSDQAGGPSASEAPALPVSLPVEREVTNYEDFTGRADAVEMVDIKARVTGYLTKLQFREGSEVKKGDLLFEIDPRPYQAQSDQADSQVKLNEASLKLAQTTYARDQAIASAVSGGVSQQQLDQDKAAMDEAQARLDASKASTKIYKLNLDFTQVKSPIDGQISRYYMTGGNLVNQDSTLLTTIVSLDPMYAYFDLDEPSLIRIRRAIVEGRVHLPEDGTMTVLMGLPSEEGYPHQGTLNFLNNQVNSSTGSISLRGIFANPKLLQGLPSLAASTTGLLLAPQGQGSLLAVTPLINAKGTRLLTPGMFVRIRLPIGTPYKARLVIDRAIQSDQDRKYVYVLDKDNKAQYRRVTIGALQPDGLRVIEGVNADEWITVGGLQQVHPKSEITPQRVPMPTLAPQSVGSDKVTR
jgi:multidrug efflux system membrane fusion protein